jgi:methyl-accepting chemotaxis protein
LGIVRLFARTHTAAPVEAAPSQPPLDELLGARLEPLMRQLEDDVMLTMRVIGYKADHSKERIGASIGLVEEIGKASDDLAAIATAAQKATNDLASTTERLDSATRSIERQAARADLFLSEARSLSEEVSAAANRMNDAVARIAGVVQLITTVARRTNLLALNAGIEAARAGPAGRGFAVIASEMKTLANQVREATGDVSSQTADLQIAARQSDEAVVRIGHLLGRLEPVFGAIRVAVEGQSAQTRDVSAHAAQSENFIGYVASKATSVKATVGEAIRACHDSGAASDDMIMTLERMTQRATVFLRHSASGNRRRFERVPVRLDGFLTVNGELHPATVYDISLGGALLRSPGSALAPNVVGCLRLPGIGSATLRVVSRSELGWHTSFLPVDADISTRIEARMAEANVLYDNLTGLIAAAARKVARIFEDGLSSGEVTLDELVTTDYRPIEGTNPIQYRTLALPFYQRVLPAIIEECRTIWEPRPIIALAIDRNAYLPVHHAEISLPQRPGETAWNDLHCRNMRLMDRWQTLIGARNTDRRHIRVYARHEPDGTVVPIFVISCPVFVRGAHWGNVQGGFNF